MTWITDEEESNRKAFWEKANAMFLDFMIYGEVEVNNPDGDKKWAWIIVNGERRLECVDNVTMKAYETDDYKFTDKEIKNYKLDRWATGHDL